MDDPAPSRGPETGFEPGVALLFVAFWFPQIVQHELDQTLDRAK